MKYFAVAWPDSGTHMFYVYVFIQRQHTITTSKKKNMGQMYKKYSKFQNLMKYYAVEWPDLGTLS